MRKIQIINYFDVWGNEEDGFQVNDLCKGPSDIVAKQPENAREVLQFLKRVGFLQKHVRLNMLDILWSDPDSIEIEQKKDGFPICRLEISEAFTVSKTFDIVTEESAENGVLADHGFEFTDRELDSVADAVRIVVEELGHFDGLSSFPTIYGTDAITDYETGEAETFALHFEGESRDLEALRAALANHEMNACK
jgi:hypothetical protein